MFQQIAGEKNRSIKRPIHLNSRLCGSSAK